MLQHAKTFRTISCSQLDCAPICKERSVKTWMRILEAWSKIHMKTLKRCWKPVKKHWRCNHIQPYGLRMRNHSFIWVGKWMSEYFWQYIVSHPHSQTRCVTVSQKPEEWMKKNAFATAISYESFLALFHHLFLSKNKQRDKCTTFLKSKKNKHKKNKQPLGFWSKINSLESSHIHKLNVTLG